MRYVGILCWLLPGCAQVLGVGDFTDQDSSGGAPALNDPNAASGGEAALNTGGQAGEDASAGAGGSIDGGPGIPTGGQAGDGGAGPTCAAAFECSGATLLSCSSGQNTVAEECPSPALCDAAAGQCNLAACELAQKQCQGRALMRCNQELTGFDLLEECASSALCDPTLDECIQPTCDSGDFQCNGQVLEGCAEDRSGFVEALDCVTDELCDDVNGLCQVAECEPDAYTCNGNALLQCSSGGTSLDFVSNCASPVYCNAVAGQCEPPLCDVGEHRCDANVLYVCNQNRDGFDEAEMCVTAALCDADAGMCRAPSCNEGEYDCFFNSLRRCNGDRTMFEAVQTCTDGIQECSLSPPSCRDLVYIVGDLDGHLVEMPCADTAASDDCAAAGHRINGGDLIGCDDTILDAYAAYTVGGAVGARYSATLHFYGVIEPKIYGEGVARGGGAASRDPGGTPTPWGIAPAGHVPPLSNYATYAIRVSDENGNEVGVYYVNSDTTEGHYTLAVDFQETITIVGGGQVVVRSFAEDCRVIKNCGANGGYPCAGKARTINIPGGVPRRGSIDQPSLGSGDPDHAGQWLLIDVLRVQRL